jgi:hypothetical protein
MLEIGKNKLDNSLFVIGDSNNISGEYIANRIINSYDLEELNCLFFTSNYRNSSLRPNCSTKHYLHYEEIEGLLENNLFRVDIIIVNVYRNFTIALNSIRKVTDLPIIFIGEKLDDFYRLDDFKYVYQLYREKSTGVYSSVIMTLDSDKYEENFLTTSFIKDIKNDWLVSLKDLQIEYYRDRKIELILKDKKE